MDSQELSRHLTLGLTFDQLAAVQTIASTGSFREAARLLCLTQPAVSQQVRQIERLLGHRLFDRRMGVGVTLTPIGERLLEFCESSIRGLNNFAAEIAARDPARESEIGIAAPADVIEYMLLPVLAELEWPHPAGAIRLRGGGSHMGLVDMVTSGMVDLAFERWPTRSSLVALARMQDHLYLVARADHEILSVPVADRPGAISRYPFAAYSSGMRSRALVQRWAEKVGANLVTHLECRNVSVMKAFVLRNNAISVIPGAPIMDELASGELQTVEIAEMPLTRSMAIVARSGEDTLERVRNFVDSFVERCQGLPTFALTDIHRVVS